jgi:hypothetical protein
MPRRNNRTSLQSRLANIVQRGMIPVEEMPGSSEWIARRKIDHSRSAYDEKESRDRFFENMTVEDQKKFKNLLPRCSPDPRWKKNEKIIDNINDWIDSNQWQFIEGGEYDGCWVNSKYPNQIFQGTSCAYTISKDRQELVEFPISSLEKDILGLACHFKINYNDLNYSICPNKWTHFDFTRKGRRQALRNKFREKKRDFMQKQQELKHLRLEEEKRLSKNDTLQYIN